MEPPTPPKVKAVEVVAAQPTQADSTTIAALSEQMSKPLPQVAYLVKLRLETMPQATSHGWALYVDDFRIPKYWAYKNGIYFKVFDPQFFADHKGKRFRFSQDGCEFIDTGMKLAPPASPAAKAKTGKSTLPLQSKILK
jgi:hypothetical protein